MCSWSALETAFAYEIGDNNHVDQANWHEENCEISIRRGAAWAEPQPTWWENYFKLLGCFEKKKFLYSAYQKMSNPHRKMF